MEYILLLVITVSLVLSLTNQFFKPFGSFVNNYMGDYISCLLETGEFPSTGNTPNSQSECDFKFKPATAGAGRPGVAGSASYSGASGKEKSNRSNDDSSGSQGSYAGSAGRQASNLNSPPPRLSNGDHGGETKVVEISIGTTDETGFNSRGSGRAFDSVGGARTNPVITYTLSSGEQKKADEDKKGASRVIASEFASRPSKKMLVKPPGTDKTATDDKVEEWNIGDYFRYLLIAAIIILLIAVIGGQAARLTKSWE